MDSAAFELSNVAAGEQIGILTGPVALFARRSAWGEATMTYAIETLTDGLTFAEGPRWHEGRLWFSDFYAHAVKSVGMDGDLRLELELDDQPSGLGWMPDGSMLVVGMTQRKLWRRTADGRLQLHADLGAVASGHCNDMVVDRTGRAYVGNFGFDLDAAIREVGIQGILAHPPLCNLICVQPDGSVTVAAPNLRFPNGTVINAEGDRLIVAETFGLALTAFDIAPDGTLRNRRTWADLGGRAPDGIALDADGAIWVANPFANECVRIAEGGALLATVKTPDPCYAAMLGGPDGRTLFMATARIATGEAGAPVRSSSILATRVEAPGAGLP